jgi:hypothetical protein
MDKNIEYRILNVQFQRWNFLFPWTFEIEHSILEIPHVHLLDRCAAPVLLVPAATLALEKERVSI